MKYILDTCTISETAKRIPSERMLHWIKGVPAEDLYLSSVTVGEIAKGISKLADDDSRRLRLELWFDEIKSRFARRILAFDEMTAIVWGRMVGEGLRRGRTISLADSQIAATARVHGMQLVTRNVDDMAGMGVPILNPFE